MGGLGSGQVLPPGRPAPLLSLTSLSLGCLAHTSLTEAGKGVGATALPGFCLLFGRAALGLCEEAASRPLDLPSRMNTDGHIKPVILFSLHPEVLPWRRGPEALRPWGGWGYGHITLTPANSWPAAQMAGGAGAAGSQYPTTGTGDQAETKPARTC